MDISLYVRVRHLAEFSYALARIVLTPLCNLQLSIIFVKVTMFFWHDDILLAFKNICLM